MQCFACEGFGTVGRRAVQCRECDGHGFTDPARGQSRKTSFVEVCTGTVIGFVVALVTTHFVMPLFGHPVTTAENFGITAIFTVVSIVRGYCVRRLFETRRHQ